MIEKAEAKKLINDVFEEEALVLGGMAVLQEIDHCLAWRLVKNLDAIRRKALRRVDAEDDDGTGQSDFTQSPAIAEFLRTIRRG